MLSNKSKDGYIIREFYRFFKYYDRGADVERELVAVDCGVGLLVAFAD